MTMITGQLQASDTTKQEYATLADEGGVNATLWFGIESVILQVNSAGHVVLVYDNGLGGDRKPVFMGFFWEIAATSSFVQTEPDGAMSVELTHEHAWQPAGFTFHPDSGGLMPTDRCTCGALRYPYSPEVK